MPPRREESRSLLAQLIQRLCTDQSPVVIQSVNICESPAVSENVLSTPANRISHRA